MVLKPMLRGLLGIEALDGGRTLRFAPAIPATWDRVEVRGVRLGAAQYDLKCERSSGRVVIRIASRGTGAHRVVLAPAFPIDARVSRVTVNGAVVNHRMVPIGDVQRAEAAIELALNTADIVFSVEEGTEVYVQA